jgi:hypothetical protein
LAVLFFAISTGSSEPDLGSELSQRFRGHSVISLLQNYSVPYRDVEPIYEPVGIVWGISFAARIGFREVVFHVRIKTEKRISGVRPNERDITNAVVSNVEVMWERTFLERIKDRAAEMVGSK